MWIVFKYKKREFSLLKQDFRKILGDLPLIFRPKFKYQKLVKNKLQFLEKGKSTTDSTKILMYVFGGDDGTAYGAGKDSIGMLWSPAVRIHKPPYGALAHELGHSFQYLTGADGHFGFKNGGSIWEMTSQWMLWQVYPNWIEFENYHLQAFLDNTYRAFLHEENMYHSPFVLEYWSNKHGKTFIGELWRNSKKGEDPVLTYQRLTNIDQKTFNDEIFDAYRRFLTWDMPRIEEVSSKYANIHHTKLDEIEDDWFRISVKEAPQNYGYNAISLEVPTSGSSSSRVNWDASLSSYLVWLEIPEPVTGGCGRVCGGLSGAMLPGESTPCSPHVTCLASMRDSDSTRRQLYRCGLALARLVGGRCVCCMRVCG